MRTKLGTGKKESSVEKWIEGHTLVDSIGLPDFFLLDLAHIAKTSSESKTVFSLSTTESNYLHTLRLGRVHNVARRVNFH